MPWRERIFDPFEKGWVQDPSGLYVPEDTAVKQPAAVARPGFIDLFCGAGGFSLGFIHAGFSPLACLDNDVYSLWTYLHNLASPLTKLCFATPEDKRRWYDLKHYKDKQSHKERLDPETWGSGYKNTARDQYCGVQVAWFGDARNITGDMILESLKMEIGEVDCVIGSPPCQGFSRMGKRDVLDPRNSLVFEFIRLVHEIKPRIWVMENVPDMETMITPSGIPVVDAICKIAEDQGYLATIRALDRVQGRGARSLTAIRRAEGHSPSKVKKSKKERAVPEKERLF